MPVFRSPTATVGLAVRNGEKLLPRAIESWLEQDFEDFELNISDNGSSDGTQAICLAYCKKDKRINYYRYHKDMGQVRSFGRLVESAKGQYFCLAFHNDFFAPNYLSSCLEILGGDHSTVLCYAGTRIVDDEGRTLADVTDKFRLDQEDVCERYTEILSKLDLCNSFHGVMRTAEAQETMPFDYCAAGDVTFLAKMVLKGKFVQLNNPMCFRSKPNHMTLKTLADRYHHLERIALPHLPSRELTSLPFTALIMILVDHICTASLEDDIKEKLIRITYEVLFARYKNQVIWELNHLIAFLHSGNVRYLWKATKFNKSVPRSFPSLYRAYLMKRFQEMDLLINFFPKYADLYYITGSLLAALGRFEEAKFRAGIALRINPNHQPANLLLAAINNGSKEGEKA